MVSAFIYYLQYDLYVKICYISLTRKNIHNTFSDLSFVKAIQGPFGAFTPDLLLEITFLPPQSVRKRKSANESKEGAVHYVPCCFRFLISGS